MSPNKTAMEDDLDLVEEEEELVEEPAPQKKRTVKKSTASKRYAPGPRVESGLEDMLKLKQDNLKGMTLDNMTEMERRRWDQLNNPPEEPQNAGLMMLAQNPHLFDGMDPGQKSMMIASMTNPQMSQMIPLMMLLKPGGNQTNNQQQGGYGLQEVLTIAQLFAKSMQPPQPQQNPYEEQIRQLQYQLANVNRQSQPKNQPDPMITSMMSQMQKNIETLAQKVESVAVKPQDPIESFSSMMSMFEKVRSLTGSGPISKEDIQLRQLEQTFNQRKLDKEFELQKKALDNQSAALKNQGMASVIQNGIKEIMNSVGQPIANIFQQQIKDNMNKQNEPATIPLMSIDESSLNKMVTPPAQTQPPVQLQPTPMSPSVMMSPPNDPNYPIPIQMPNPMPPSNVKLIDPGDYRPLDVKSMGKSKEPPPSGIFPITEYRP